MSTPTAVINDLKLVNVDYTRLRPELEIWGQDKGVIFVKTCSRKTWIGARGDFQDFPETIGNERKTVYEGVDAYGFLIRLKAGMESNKLGETNIDGQFLEACNSVECQQKQAERARLFDLLKADSRYIRTKYIDFLQKGTIESAAKALASPRKGDTVLIISSTGRNHTIPQITLDLICANSAAARILLTSPDETDLPHLEENARRMAISKKMKDPHKISSVPATEIHALIDKGCHIYINLPMGDYAYYDSMITNAWKNRENPNHKMVHLRGSPHNGGNSTKFWNSQDMKDYFSPEKVRLKKVEIDMNNTRLISEANIAIDKVANARSSGITAYAHKILTCSTDCLQQNEPAMV